MAHYISLIFLMCMLVTASFTTTNVDKLHKQLETFPDDYHKIIISFRAFNLSDSAVIEDIIAVNGNRSIHDIMVLSRESLILVYLYKNLTNPLENVFRFRRYNEATASSVLYTSHNLRATVSGTLRGVPPSVVARKMDVLLKLIDRNMPWLTDISVQYKPMTYTSKETAYHTISGKTRHVMYSNSLTYNPALKFEGIDCEISFRVIGPVMNDQSLEMSIFKLGNNELRVYHFIGNEHQ